MSMSTEAWPVIGTVLVALITTVGSVMVGIRGARANSHQASETTDDAWRDRIGSIACGYARYRGLVEAARRRAYDVYGVERIAADWLQFCSALLHSKAAR